MRCTNVINLPRFENKLLIINEVFVWKIYSLGSRNKKHLKYIKLNVNFVAYE